MKENANDPETNDINNEKFWESLSLSFQVTFELLEEDAKRFGIDLNNLPDIEVKKPEKNSKLIAEQIASQIEARFPYRRAVKQAITNAMRSGALGIKVMVSGRLNNAEMARTESFKEGRIPLHTLRADIDYGTAEALTSFGLIGIKVWLYNGDVLTKDQEDEEDKYSVKRKTR